MERISVPELREVGIGLDAADLPLLTELAFPRLRTVGGSLRVSQVLSDWSVPCLDSVAGDTALSSATDAPSLVTIGGDLQGVLDGPLLATLGGILYYERGQNLPALYQVGGLEILSADTVALPALKAVDGAARLGCGHGDAITAGTLSLPELRRAGALTLCPWPALASVDLARLRRIAGPAADGGLSIEVATALTAVSLPALIEIVGPGTFQVATDMPALATVRDLTVYAPVSAPSLTSVSNLVLRAPLSADALATVNGGLEASDSIDLPGLATVAGDMLLNTVAGTLVFPALTSVGGRVTASGNAAATEFSAPLLASIGRSLAINVNTVLANIDFGSLTSLGSSLSIRANPQLPTCQTIALRDQLRAAGWTGNSSINGNGTGTCP